MEYRILHKADHEIHLDLKKRRLTNEEADVLYYNLLDIPGVNTVSVYYRTAQVIVRFNKHPDRKLSSQGFDDDHALVSAGADGEAAAVARVLRFISNVDFTDPVLKDNVPQISGRATNEEYKEKIGKAIMARFAKRIFLPAPLRVAFAIKDGFPYIKASIKDLADRNFSAEIVHGSAILASLLTGDFGTAESITFLTNIGDIMEEWTYKKSVDDLARSLALNVSNAWKVTESGKPELVNLSQIKEGDLIQVYMGNVIPLDGEVWAGEAMVNQSALTGESVAVHKDKGLTVYAGTVIDEGDLIIKVKETSGKTRYDNIVKFIEQSESMTAVTQSQAKELVSKLIPYTFGTAAVTLLLTRNVTKAASVLMVDFSCAIEVAMPIAVLSAMRESGAHHITVKGGRYLEMISEADTIVFDKTGTLTKSIPTVEQVLAVEGRDADEMLALAADLESHFPHSLANAVVEAAKKKGLSYGKPHSKPEYIVAHGIVTNTKEGRVLIGSYHFVFEDEGVELTDEGRALMEKMPVECSQLYVAINGKLAAVIGIDDPIKTETAEIIRRLKNAGIKNIVMMTGDSERTAKAIAERAGIDKFYSEVLPEDKAKYVEEQKNEGHRVIMIGDGINDSPALSAADIGIAMKEGADIAREISDITIPGSELEQLIALKELSNKLMLRMKSTGVLGIGFNAAILIAGILGRVTPGTAALLHNTSTIGLCLRNMQNMVPDEEEYLIAE